jgi:hypothetical protein
VRVQPETVKIDTPDATQAGLDLVKRQSTNSEPTGKLPTDDTDSDLDELTLIRGWIAFDEENVVVLKEQSQGRQALVVYDFT